MFGSNIHCCIGRATFLRPTFTELCTPFSVSLSTSHIRLKKQKSVVEGLKKDWKKKYRNIFVNEEDLDKRPSAVEIKEKDLPSNTPTLGERLNRDVYRLFHQADEKHGYHNLRKNPESLLKETLDDLKEGLDTNPKETIKDSFQTVAREIRLFAEEVKNFDVNDAIDSLPGPGGRRKEWGFENEVEMSKWILTKDSDWGEGYSAAEWELSPQGHAILRGDLSTRVPADGRTQNAGYVNIASVKKRKSFAREVLMDDWGYFSHLTMNIRGDGRKYLINLQVKREIDILWNDRWHYPLYTRGGPYWQYVKIPWSKFYLGSRGSIQDRQMRVPLEAGVVGMSITLMDRISGPFQLEIKDISLHCDPQADEEDFAYEMYKIPNFWAGH